MNSIQFRNVALGVIADSDHASALKEAALHEHLTAWTSDLTKVAVETCQKLGWKASAKSHKLELLPVQRSEYLGLDVIAFGGGEKRWRFPVAVMELENVQHEDRIAYSLWKVLCVRAELRVVFCYRKSRGDAAELMKHLSEHVVMAMGLDSLVNLPGTTLVVVGSRSRSDTFPHGFFTWWELNRNIGRFERL